MTCWKVTQKGWWSLTAVTQNSDSFTVFEWRTWWSWPGWFTDDFLWGGSPCSAVGWLVGWKGFAGQIDCSTLLDWHSKSPTNQDCTWQSTACKYGWLAFTFNWATSAIWQVQSLDPNGPKLLMEDIGSHLGPATTNHLGCMKTWWVRWVFSHD